MVQKVSCIMCAPSPLPNLLPNLWKQNRSLSYLIKYSQAVTLSFIILIMNSSYHNWLRYWDYRASINYIMQEGVGVLVFCNKST